MKRIGSARATRGLAGFFRKAKNSCRMEYGGRSVSYWERMLAWPRASVSRFAVRALSALGRPGAEALVRSARPTPEAAWALCRTEQTDLIAACPLARLMTSPGTGPDPVRRLRQSRRLLPAFFWAAQLEERDTSALVDILRHAGTSAVVQAAAWALGRIGRLVLPECADACRQAAASTRRRLCLVFWYLGPQARSLADTLAAWLPDPDAETALLALEDGGSVAMVRALRPDQPAYPVWLDPASVEALAGLAFGNELRVAAARALGGFGSAGASAAKVLTVLAEDKDPPVQVAALEALTALGYPEGLRRLLRIDAQSPVLQEIPASQWQELLEHDDLDCQLQALLRCDPSRVPSTCFERLHELRKSSSHSVRLAAIRLLTGIPLACGPWLTEPSCDPDPEVRVLALRGSRNRAALEAALADPSPAVQAEAARRLLDLGDEFFKRVLLHPSAAVRERAAERATREPGLIALARELLLAGQANPTVLHLLDGIDVCPELGQCLRICPPRDRLWLARQLARRQSLPTCLELLGSDSPGVRRAGAAALRWTIALRPAVTFDLEALLDKEPSWSVRTLLAETLGLVAERSESARLARHPLARVAWHAVGALSLVDAHLALEALDHSHPKVRRAALRVLQGSHLRDQLKRYQDHPDVELRRAAYEALIADGDCTFERGWRDQDPAIQELVCDHLDELPTEMEASIARGEPTSRKVLETFGSFVGMKRFAQVVGRSLPLLSPDKRELMARRLGYLEEFDPLLDYWLDDPDGDGARMLERALDQARNPLPWIKRYKHVLESESSLFATALSKARRSAGTDTFP